MPGVRFPVQLVTIIFTIRYALFLYLELNIVNMISNKIISLKHDVQGGEVW